MEAPTERNRVPTDPKRRPRIRPSGGSIILLVAVLLGVVVLAPTVQQFVAQRQRVADLHASIAATETEIANLQAQEVRWSDPAYIEAQARGRLLFVKPGETAYLVTDSSGGTPAAPPPTVSVDMHETQTDWVATLAQSFVEAGQANAPAAPPADSTEPTPGATP